jgi:hypothetical protein
MAISFQESWSTVLARTSRRMTALVPIAVLACVLAACSSETTEPAGAPSSETSDVNTAPETPEVNAAAEVGVPTQDGYPLPTCSGQDPASCTYDGFDPAVHGFNFPNWAQKGELDATGMVALFGAKAVCAKKTATGCVLYPAAREWAEQVNEAMAGGHCEGMAVMAARLFRGDALLADLDPNAGSTFELTFEDPDVRQAIDLWWTTQMLAPVQEAYTSFHSYRPSEIAAELAVGLQTGKGYTMGIYGPQGGHGITPFAVTQEGDRIAISVYDNNFPGTVQRIYIDPVTERWSYAMGSTNPDAPTGGWEGSTGTIELTPMASRALPAAAPFDDSGKRNKAARFSYLMVTSPDPEARVGLELTVDGQTYDTTDLAAALPEGVASRPIIGSVLAGKGTVMTIDRSVVKSFTATAKKGTVPDSGGMSEETPVTLSIDAVGSPRVTARYVASEAGGVEVSSGGSNGVSLVAAPGSEADVNVANGLSSVDFPLPDGLGMTVSKVVNGVSDIEYVDEDGNVIGEFAVDAETEGGDVIDAVAEFDEKTGEFSVTEEVAEEETLDELPSVFIGSDDSPDADAGSDADVSDGAGAGANDDRDAGADEGSGSGAGGGADPDTEPDSGANDDAGQEGDQPGQDSADAARPDDAADPAADEPEADQPAADQPGADDPGPDDPAGDEPAADPADDSEQQ